MQSSQMGNFVPDNVKNFIAYFRRHVNEGNVPGILSMYETVRRPKAHFSGAPLRGNSN